MLEVDPADVTAVRAAAVDTGSRDARIAIVELTLIYIHAVRVRVRLGIEQHLFERPFVGKYGPCARRSGRAQKQPTVSHVALSADILSLIAP